MPHYYSENKGTRFEPFTIKINALGREAEVYSTHGVFSKKELDNGTKTLIENAVVNEGDYVLDMGCGYGAVGILFGLKYDIKVLMTDVNEIAVRLSKMNIKKLRLDGKCNAKKSNLYENIPEKFDVILTNPPHTAGREVCYAIITGAYEHLNENGSLQLVARHNKGGEMLQKKMQEVFGNAEKIGKGSGFTVYLARKN